MKTFVYQNSIYIFDTIFSIQMASKLYIAISELSTELRETSDIS